MNNKRIPVENEIPKHKKKSKKKGFARADHKHDYKTVLLHYHYTFKNIKTGKEEKCERAFPTEVCCICGKIGYMDNDDKYYDFITDTNDIFLYTKKVLNEKALSLEKWETDGMLSKFARKVE